MIGHRKMGLKMLDTVDDFFCGLFSVKDEQHERDHVVRDIRQL
jgi:hypothetical protein